MWASWLILQLLAPQADSYGNPLKGYGVEGSKTLFLHKNGDNGPGLRVILSEANFSDPYVFGAIAMARDFRDCLVPRMFNQVAIRFISGVISTPSITFT